MIYANEMATPEELAEFVRWLEQVKGYNIPDLLFEFIRWKQQGVKLDPKRDN